MKLLPYKEILKYSKEKIEISKLEEQIANQECKITEIAAEHPINFDKLIESLDELKLAERRKEQLKTIIDDLFAE
jgi:uncharacterized coiled-coil protein SlyX